MDPDEVKAAIEAVFRAAQPRDDDVASDCPSNVYILSDAEGDQRLSDVLTCLVGDR
jgi:hypothetical protein